MFGVPNFQPAPPLPPPLLERQQHAEQAAAEAETEAVDQEESRREALRQEIGLADTFGTQAARGALDALLAPGALAGLGAQAAGETIGSEGLAKFGRDLGRASSGKSAAEALGFILGGGDIDRADRARKTIERQEEARPTLATISRMAGATAFGLGLGAAGGAGRAAVTIAGNALEGAGGGAQMAYENNADAPLRDVLTYAAVGGLLGGGLAAAGEGAAYGVRKIGEKIGAGDLDKVFGKVQQFADERMVKTAIGNDARTMRILTDNGKDFERIARVADKMRQADLPNNADEMLGAISRQADDATGRLSSLASELDAKGFKPSSTEIFGEIYDQTNKLRRLGTGDAETVANAVERQVAPLRESLAIKQADQFGNEVVTGYRDPTFTDLRRFKTGLGQALKWHKRAPSISDDAMSELYGNVARRLDSAADAAGPEVGAAWRRANQDASDWITVQGGLEEEMQRRLKNRFISPSDYGTGLTGALMTMIATGGSALPAIAGGAVAALGHKALRYGTNKVVSNLANRLARTRFHFPATKAGGTEASQVMTQIGRTRKFIDETADAAGQNPSVRETAQNAAREVAAEAMAKAAGKFDPANWSGVNPVGKVVYRSEILDRASQDVAEGTARALSMRAPLPQQLDPGRLVRLTKDADGQAAIGGMQAAVRELFDGAPPTPAGSAALRAIRQASNELSRSNPAESFAIGHRLSQELGALSRSGAASPDLDLVASKGLENLQYPKDGMRPESFARVREEYASGQPMRPVEVTIFPDGDIVFQDGRHRMAVAKELGIAEIPTRVSRMDETGDIVSEVDGVLPLQPGQVARSPADAATITFRQRANAAIQEALGSDAFGEAGRQYRKLVATPHKAAEILTDPAALREALREMREPGQISAATSLLVDQIQESYSAARAFGGKDEVRALAEIGKELGALRKLSMAAEDATTLDGKPMSHLVELAQDGPKPINPETEVLETVGAEVNKIAPILKGTVAKGRGGIGRLVPGAAAAGAAGAFASRQSLPTPEEQQKTHDKRLDMLARVVAQPETVDIPGGPEVAASMGTKLQQLLADMPKPIETLRGKQPLSSDDLRKANAMWEATLEPLSVFQDFARGTVDHEKAKYAWKQYPGLQQAAQAGVLDVITNDLDDSERAAMPDPMLAQLDYLVGFGGKLQPTVNPEFAARMSSLPVQQQKDQPRPGGMLELPGSEPTHTQKIAQTL